MIDAVLSYHTNPYTCGVAKFNQRLARELGVPLGAWGQQANHPLLSVKFAELRAAGWIPAIPKSFDLFMHDQPALDAEWQLVFKATNIHAANAVIADAIRHSGVT